MSSPRKLFCYVDETGQDTRGELFIISVVITAEERDQLVQICEQMEQLTGKGRVKWIKAQHHRRIAYLRQLIELPLLNQKIIYGIYHNTQDYVSLTVRTIALALRATGERQYKVTILIDGLPRTQERTVGLALLAQQAKVKKVRGVKKEENGNYALDTVIEQMYSVSTLFAKKESKCQPFKLLTLSSRALI